MVVTAPEIICEPRWATRRSPDRKSLGFVAANIAEALGTPFLPWQALIADCLLEIDPETGRFAYRRCCCVVPRQSGKTTLCLALILTRALALPRQTIVFTAQHLGAARAKLVDDWLPVLDQTEFSKHYTKRLANGSEGLKFSNGSRLTLAASTVKSLHGNVTDVAIIDEAWAQPDHRLEQAITPSMVTRPQPLLMLVSTMGAATGSDYLMSNVEAGRQAVDAGVQKGVAYFEWSAADGADPADAATWWSCMPALGRTVTEDAVRASFQAMPRKEFERAFCNVPTSSIGEPVIDLDLWESLADPDAERPGDVVLGVDVSPGGRSASICAVGERDGVLYASVLESGPGTEWLVPALDVLADELAPSEVICDAKAAGPLLASFRRGRVTEASAQDMATGCLFLQDIANNRRLRHRGELELRAAVDGAAQRHLADGFSWSRKNSAVDISSLVALTLGVWAFHGSFNREMS